MASLRRAAMQVAGVLLGAGIWLASNLLFYLLYHVAPVRLPQRLGVGLYYASPLFSAVLAQAWTISYARASGRWRRVLTGIALLAHAGFLIYYAAFSLAI